MAKKRKQPGQLKPRKKRGSTTLLGRIFVVLLSILLGMAIVIGAEAAILYGLFGWATLNKAEEYLGLDLGGELVADDSVLRDLTVLGMFMEFAEVSGKLSEFTAESLLSEYGVKLPEVLKELVPDAVMQDVPLSELLGPNAAHVLLEHVTFGNLLALAGDGLLPPAAYDKIKDRPASLVLDGDLAAVFEGVYAGDLLGIAVEENGEGGVDPVPGEDGELHLMSYIATLDIGEYLAAEDRNVVLQNTLDRTPVDVLVEGQGDNLIMKALKGKTLGDIMKMENGGFYFDTDVLIADLYLGDALGYTYDEDEGAWYDQDGNAPNALLAELVGITVLELPSSDVMGTVEGMRIYELMEYEKQDTGDVDENGDPVYEYVKKDKDGNVTDTMEGLVASFADLTVADLQSDDALNGKLESVKIGTVMGYTEVDGVWKKDGEAATGIMRPLLGSTVSTMNERIDELYLGEVMGFDNLAEEGQDPVFKKDKDGDGDYDEEELPDSLMSYFVDMQLKDIDEDGAFTDRIQSVKVGDVMGYTYIESEDKWYSEHTTTGGSKNTLATGVTAALAGATVDGMDEAVKTVKVGDVMGYTYIESEGKWYSEHTTTGGSKNTPATGIYAALADYEVDKMDEAVKTVKVGEAMGYTKKDDGKWYEGSTPVTNTVLLSVIDEEIGDMNTALEDMTLASALGYTRKEPDDGKWYEADGETEVTNTFILAMADTKVSLMSQKMNTMKFGEVMGYTYDEEDEVWKDGESPVTNTFILSMADTKVSEMSQKMNTLKLGDAMGYDKRSDGWYKNKTSDDKVGETGYLSLIGLDTQMSGLNEKLEDLDDLKVGQLVDAKILAFTEGQIRTLNNVFKDGEGNPNWREQRLATFMSSFVQETPAP